MKAPAAAFALLLVAAPRVARAEDARLDEARRRHRALDYERCVEALRAPPSATATNDDLVEAAILAGVCEFELGHARAAHEHWKRAVGANPRAMLPPYSSPKMVAAFTATSAEAQAERPAAPATTTPPAMTPMPPPAATPSPVLSAPPEPARAVPFAPILLGGAAAIAAGVGVIAYADARSAEGDANRARFESDAYALGDRARSSMTMANVALGGAAALAAAAIVVWVASAR